MVCFFRAGVAEPLVPYVGELRVLGSGDTARPTGDLRAVPDPAASYSQNVHALDFLHLKDFETRAYRTCFSQRKK